MEPIMLQHAATTAPDFAGIATMSIAATRAELATVVGRARHAKSPTVLTSRGRPVAAVVPIEDLELIEDAIDRRMADEARAAIAAGEQAIPWEDVKAALAKQAAKSAGRTAAKRR
jgi:prevent-host-death family protein